MSDRDEEWGPWIEHDGRGRPDLEGFYLQVKVRRDFGLPATKRDWCEHIRPWTWALKPWPVRIIAYRIRRPKALRDMIERIETLPAPQPERETA